MYCKNCGHKNKKHLSACERCGCGEFKKKKHIGLIVIIILVLLLAGAGVYGYFYYYKTPERLFDSFLSDIAKEVDINNKKLDINIYSKLSTPKEYKQITDIINGLKIKTSISKSKDNIKQELDIKYNNKEVLNYILYNNCVTSKDNIEGYICYDISDDFIEEDFYNYQLEKSLKELFKDKKVKSEKNSKYLIDKGYRRNYVKLDDDIIISLYTDDFFNRNICAMSITYQIGSIIIEKIDDNSYNLKIIYDYGEDKKTFTGSIINYGSGNEIDLVINLKEEENLFNYILKVNIKFEDITDIDMKIDEKDKKHISDIEEFISTTQEKLADNPGFVDLMIDINELIGL